MNVRPVIDRGGVRRLRWVGLAGVAALALAVSGAMADDDDHEDVTDVLDKLAEALGAKSIGLPDPATDDDFYPRDEAKEELGKLLFFDKILSGNGNISCATCHHPLTDTGDGLSLPVGEGARGLGVTRNTGEGSDAVPERVPRNAPHVYNLGAMEFVTMFHDGRVQVDPSQPSGFRSPAGDLLPMGLDNVLAAQAMFPVTSGTEMAGQLGENPVANLADAGDLVGVWERLAQRLRRVPEYRRRFLAVFDDIEAPGDIEYMHAANAIAAYEAAAFRADNSPFDRYLRGDSKALSKRARKGMKLFYGAAGCSSCHSGTFQTNHQFAAAAMPQIGPGKGDNQRGYEDGHDDFGRERVTGRRRDRFKFRVLSLRNVAITGPWGHGGAYNTLEAIVRHQCDPVSTFHAYDTTQAVLPSRPDLDALDFIVQTDGRRRTGIARRCELEPVSVSDEDVANLIDFLHALTDPDSLDDRSKIPMAVPSGLPVFD